MTPSVVVLLIAALGCLTFAALLLRTKWKEYDVGRFHMIDRAVLGGLIMLRASDLLAGGFPAWVWTVGWGVLAINCWAWVILLLRTQRGSVSTDG